MITPEQHREIEARLERNRRPSGDCITDRNRQKKEESSTVGVEDEIRDLHKPSETGSIRIVLDFWASEGVPAPRMEQRFCERKWRFDFCWPSHDLALEVQGGIWTKGRHVRGAALLKEWEKLNEAAIFGWRILYAQPSDLMTVKLAETIKRALGLSR